MPQFSILVNDGTGPRLQITPNRFLCFAQQRLRLSHGQFFDVASQGKRLPIEEISAARRAVQQEIASIRDLLRSRHFDN